MRTPETVTRLMERLASDDAFEARLRSDPEGTLRELGWEPQDFITFTVRERSGCGSQCGCNADMGQGCGSKQGNIVQCPSGRPGQVY